MTHWGPDNDLVSVVIPTYNSAAFIMETAGTVLNQTHQNFEIIFVDDGSTDNTVELLNELSRRDPRMRVYCQDHGGVSRARNLAISRSGGAFIALLDHDDFWLPRKLEKQLALFSNPATGVVYSDALFWLNGEKDLHTVFSRTLPRRGHVTRHLLADNFISCPTAMIRRALLEKIGVPFNPILEMCEDYDLFIRLSLITDFDYIREPMVRWRMHSSNDTFRRIERFSHDYALIYETLLASHPEVGVTYRKELKGFRKRIQYYDAFSHWKNDAHLKSFTLFLTSTKTRWRGALLAFFSLIFSYRFYLKLRYGI